MNKDFFDIVGNYEGALLLEPEVPADALELFQQWLELAIRSGEKAPTSFVLSSSTFEGKSSSRIVGCSKTPTSLGSFFGQTRGDKYVLRERYLV